MTFILRHCFIRSKSALNAFNMVEFDETELSYKWTFTSALMVKLRLCLSFQQLPEYSDLNISSVKGAILILV